jgi:hypothetical protein
MISGLKLSINMNVDLVCPTNYRSMVGKLIHFTHIRPDISYSVGTISRFMSKPQTPHEQAVKRILRYIAGTRDFGIF